MGTQEQTTEQTTEQPTDVLPDPPAEDTPRGAAPHPLETETPTEPPKEETTPEEEPSTEAQSADEPPEEVVEEPLKPEEYKLPEGVPPNVAEFASKQGFSQQQLDDVLTYFGQYITTSKAAELQTLRKLGEDHVASWGEEGKYKLNIAKRALAQNDPDGELTTALRNSGYGNHPAVLDFLYKIGLSMREGGFLKSHPGTTATGKKSAAQVLFPNHPTKEGA